ncbi:hypothetical protein D7231_32290 [Streptomyces klenkii]|uniref:Uncharacterized protein n=1 Tax=Streptomyces klenkii TaxID=1420899 RepID=A0A3B0ALA4_9ACTN|nr:hypothetical protein D7231_32290 [Streptomyces klenkii]
MSEAASATAALPPDIEEAVRAEARGLLGDWMLKTLTVVVYLSFPNMILLAVLAVHSGTFALLAAPLIPAAVALLAIAHRPWQHAVRRSTTRKEARAEQWAEWQLRRRRRFRHRPF